MSDSFLLATRIPMTRENFERWLDTPAPDPSVIADPDAMFDGWYWHGKRAAGAWRTADVGATPRDFFGGCVTAASTGSPVTCVLTHRDGALEAYICDLLGYAEYFVHTALLMFAAAGELASDVARHPVLFWAETAGRLLDPGSDAWLAVLTVGRGGARFTADTDLTAAVAALEPVEDRFDLLVERMADAEEAWNRERPYRVSAPRDPLFADPALMV